MGHPLIIQGGMGIAVSSWNLARQVSLLGELGVVSGTAMTSVLVRRLQDGDPGGHMRDALAHFPAPELADEILRAYFLPEGRAPGASYKLCPVSTMPPSLALERLTVVACFAEVYAAKQGHQGLVGINLLEKIQLPNLASLYGAMLANVDYVIMGAGIPREIPGALDRFAKNQEASLRIHVLESTEGMDHRISFDPQKVIPLPSYPELKRPQFLAVVSSVALAANLAKKATGYVDGFVIENKTAGGHNAPPRGALQLSQKGEPIYGPKDEVDLKAFCELGRPFWLAGAFATPEKLKAALAAGASGIQVGTMFAFASESGLSATFKEDVRKLMAKGEKPVVFTDPLASPSGFPFKVVQLEGSMAEADVYAARPRRCDLGYLRMPYQRADNKIDFRCPSEPINNYLRKGGDLKETEGRKCLCNGLLAAIDLPQQRREGYKEVALITAGDELAELNQWSGGRAYSVADVIGYLRGLLQELRVKTARVHTELQQLPFHQALSEKKLNPLSLTSFLRCLAIVYSSLETELTNCKDERVTRFWDKEQAKLPLVNKDLQLLEAEPKPAIAAAVDRALEVSRRIVQEGGQTPLFLLGVLYVTEGSQNGGLYLKSLVAQCFGLEADKLSYFGAYGAKTAQFWEGFTAKLDALTLTAVEARQVVSGATFAFTGFGKIIEALHPFEQTEVRYHASAINAEAGAHAVPQDPEEVEIAFLAGKNAWAQFPYLQARFGERGQRFTGSDSCWLLTLYRLDIEAIRKNILWLRGVLSVRGLPSIILELHMGEILRRLCEKWPTRRGDLTAFESIIRELNALRTKHIDQRRASEMIAKYDERLRAAVGLKFSDATRLLISARADELSGIANAFRVTESWFIDPSRFTNSWITVINELAGELRGIEG